MNIDPQQLDPADVYKILAGSVVPRPIAWVSTVDEAGTPNLAPFSFFNVVSANPPTLSVSISAQNGSEPRKDTLRNIQATGQFTVNLVNEALASAMNLTATDFPPEVDEFAVAGLTAAPGATVRSPRVAEAPVSFECALLTTVQVGTPEEGNTLVLGTVTHIHVSDEVIGERYHIDMAKLNPIGRIAGAQYAYIREFFSIPRPSYNRETGEVEGLT